MSRPCLHVHISYPRFHRPICLCLTSGWCRVDLYISTRTGNVPQFPYMRTEILPLQVHPVAAMDASRTWSESDSPGLASVRDVSENMHRLMTHMVQLTEVADLWTSNPDSGKTLTTVLTLGRNQIQHRLLSYPTSQYNVTAFAPEWASSIPADNTLALTELIRLAASVYASIATFPLPSAAGVKQRLAERFRKVWSTGQMHRPAATPQATTHAELKLWLLWFGCFAAYRSTHQKWLERELRWALRALYGPQWEETVTFEMVKGSLRGFLWWDLVCDMPGQDLWLRLKSQTSI